MDFRLSDEQEMFRKSVRDYVNRELPKSWARDLEKDEHAFPHELFGKLATAGFHAIGIPEEYGGQGGDIMTQMLLARELARSLAGLTWVWGITSFAGGKSVGIYGTPEQKQRHLPAIAAGREKCAIGFTEPGGGTDVLGAMRTVASAGGRRLGHQRPEDVELDGARRGLHPAAGQDDQGRGQAAPGRVAVHPAHRVGRRDHPGDPEAGHARAGLVRRVP